MVETSLQKVMMELGEAFLILSPYNNRICFANRAAEKLLGYSHHELIELDVSALHHSEMPALITFTDSVIDKGSGWTNELSVRRKDGEELKMEYSATRIKENGELLLAVVLREVEQLQRAREQSEANAYVKRGISEWKRIEMVFKEIERENQLMLQAVGDGIYGVNSDGKTTFLNPAAERMLGFKAEELVGEDIHAVIHHSHSDGSHYPATNCPIYAAFNDGEIHSVDNEVFFRKDGTAIPVEYTSTPIKDQGRLVGAVVIFRDISDRKRAEQNLRQALQEVEELKQRLELENAYLQEEIRTEHNYKEIVGNSDGIQQVVQQIRLVAPTDASVLIYGESGTGKELIARAIHESSERCKRPLIRVNCAAIPADLFESEFFGHIKGAFTGATQDRAGRFELADGGTLFLDEVGEIPLELQGKLLRVLQEGQFERIGENRTREVDVRVIAATNRDLKSEVAQGRFREDLYFRLNVFPIESISLRDRRGDIPLLAQHFLNHASHRFNKVDVRLRQSDILQLKNYNWPGNIRELQNVIERAVILSQQGRLALDLPSHDSGVQAVNEETWSKLPSRDELRLRERAGIIGALRQSQGKVFGEDGAAKLLGMKPTTLSSKIKRLGINRYIYKLDEGDAARE
ncbi:MAG: sigma 54-interacting transcriptional regulator [Gammaproteobacteria bacterium]|nr:sigma 54-interacting transcriptional regulator [Gammaproteobacteria bacterium]